MKTNCFILKWDQMPEKIQSQVMQWHGLRDCLIPITSNSEFTVEDYRKGMEAIDNLHRNSTYFRGTLEEFIDDYRLDFDVWFINQKFDLEGVDKILIDLF
jgi:hypothetical protein